MNSRELRSGFTTGTCAQAATKAAMLMLLNQKRINRIEIETPIGKKLDLEVINQKLGKDFASCAVVKDAGDDPDATDGVKIYSEVKFSKENGITIRGGKGVGKATKPGLAIGVGEYAINPVPHKMIIKELKLFLPKDKGLEVIISVPAGEKIAKHTFNERLGVVGGISILGTTGIVQPKSLDAYKTSLALELNVIKASGKDEVTLVLGYVGEKFCKEKLGLKDDSIVKIGDHVGFMLKECVKRKIKKVHLVGHIGKLVKVAGGQFNTHYSFGDNRIEQIVYFAKLCHAGKSIIAQLNGLSTAEAAIGILEKNNLMKVFDKTAEEVISRIDSFVHNKLSVRCTLLSLKGEVLARV